MSIFATLGVIQVEHPNQPDTWETIFLQGVPGHITSDYDWLPSAVEDESLRAVVVVTAETPKDGQQYVNPIAVYTGAEWETVPFVRVLEAIEDYLRRPLDWRGRVRQSRRGERNIGMGEHP